jgi:outer membrane immunogenic protein
LGLEGDFSWLDVSPTTAISGVTLKTDYDYFGTLRGRIGLAHDNLLFYLTGGLAFAHVDHRYDVPAFGFSQSDTKWSTGWTAGGGLELDRGHWRLRAEVLYVDLADTTRDYSFPAPPCRGTCASRIRWEDDFLVARVGLSFKLHREPDHQPLK